MSNDVPFTAMAERIKHNADDKFGGAFVIVAPDGGGVISDLSLADPANPGKFWASIQTLIQTKILELEQKQAQSRAYGMR